jgi:hypothetical protein
VTDTVRTLSDLLSRLKYARHSHAQDLRDMLVSVYQHGAEVRKTSNQSINDATWTAISWNSEEYDDGSYWDGANPTRITFTNAGKYLVSVNAIFDTNTTGYRYARVIRNGNQALELGIVSSRPVVANTRISLTILVNAAASAYVELEVYQDSTAALDLVGVAGTDAETTRAFVAKL